MQLLKFLLILWLTLSLYSCKIKNVTVRYEGRVVERYQVLRKSQVRHGYFKIYHENGNVAMQHNYVNGELEGLERIYHEDGSLAGELPLKNGDYQGNFVYYYPNGNVKQRGYYKDDKLNGEMCTYYRSGQTQQCVTMKNNKEEGAFREYSENGVLIRTGNYTTMLGDKEGLEDGLVYEYDSTSMKLLNKKRCKEGFCCIFWEKDKGYLRPSTSICDEIMSEAKKED